MTNATNTKPTDGGSSKARKDIVGSYEEGDTADAHKRFRAVLADLNAATADNRADRRAAALEVVSVKDLVVLALMLDQGGDWRPALAGLFSIAKIGTVLRTRLRRRRVAVLSELANELRFNGINPDSLKSLELSVVGW